MCAFQSVNFPLGYDNSNIGHSPQGYCDTKDESSEEEGRNFRRLLYIPWDGILSGLNPSSKTNTDGRELFFNRTRQSSRATWSNLDFEDNVHQDHQYLNKLESAPNVRARSLPSVLNPLRPEYCDSKEYKTCCRNRNSFIESLPTQFDYQLASYRRQSKEVEAQLITSKFKQIVALYELKKLADAS